MHRSLLLVAAERGQPLVRHAVIPNDTASTAGTGTHKDAASSARVPTALRSMALFGMAASRRGDVGLALGWGGARSVGGGGERVGRGSMAMEGGGNKKCRCRTNFYPISDFGEHKF